MAAVVLFQASEEFYSRTAILFYKGGEMKEGMMFYRCALCHRVVSIWDIGEHRGCASCGHRKISPTNLTALEKLVQIIKHPLIWRWHESVQPDA